MKHLGWAVALACAAAPMAASAQVVPGPYGATVTLAQARQIVDAGHRAARQRGFTMAFTIAMPSGEPILIEVMDGTQHGSIVVSQQKARSSARYRRSTKVFAEIIAANPGLLSLDSVVAIEGGLPIVANGRVIGAIGVSGGSAVEDGEIAAAALAAFKPG